MTQITTESNEPAGAASPIGINVSANHFDIKYDPGIRINSMDATLYANEIDDNPYAQKYPLKQKCTPAIIASMI